MRIKCVAERHIVACPASLAGLFCQLYTYQLDTSLDGCRSWAFPVEKGHHVAIGCHLVTLWLDTTSPDDVGRGGVFV